MVLLALGEGQKKSRFLLENLKASNIRVVIRVITLREEVQPCNTKHAVNICSALIQGRNTTAIEYIKRMRVRGKFNR